MLGLTWISIMYWLYLKLSFVGAVAQRKNQFRKLQRKGKALKEISKDWGKKRKIIDIS
jgi:hypothetical protein